MVYPYPLNESLQDHRLRGHLIVRLVHNDETSKAITSNGRFHALSSQELYDAADKACNGSFARCFWPNPNHECPEACGDAVTAATTFAMDGSIDIYDIYEDVCLQVLGCVCVCGCVAVCQCQHVYLCLCICVCVSVSV